MQGNNFCVYLIFRLINNTVKLETNLFPNCRKAETVKKSWNREISPLNVQTNL